jgi:hypothetical protein
MLIIKRGGCAPDALLSSKAYPHPDDDMNEGPCLPKSAGGPDRPFIVVGQQNNMIAEGEELLPVACCLPGWLAG